MQLIVLTLLLLMIKETHSVCVNQDTEWIYQIILIALVSEFYKT